MAFDKFGRRLDIRAKAKKAHYYFYLNAFTFSWFCVMALVYRNTKAGALFGFAIMISLICCLVTWFDWRVALEDCKKKKKRVDFYQDVF